MLLFTIFVDNIKEDLAFNKQNLLKFEEIQLSGFGKYPKTRSKVSRPTGVNEIKDFLKSGEVTPRGLGRSYGDAAISDCGIVAESLLMNRFISFDESSGILQCEAGISYKDILDTFAIRGWFPYVTPGTKYVTIGGAIASDVHGKNHHKEGSFSNFLISMRILLSSGEVIECSRENNADLFWATIGGMGLTGFILDAVFRLRKIENPYMTNKVLKLKNLTALFEKFEEYNEDYIYSVAWMDIVASGSKYGRNILMLGNHAGNEELNSRLQLKSKEKYVEKKISVPFEIPFTTLNKVSISLFNSAFYMKARTKEDFQHYDKYFYPLDFILNWNHIYSKSGLIQYQLNIPEDRGQEAVDKVLKKVVEFGGGSFLAVLKKMGDQEGILSFPFKGYTLSMDFPVKKGVIKMCKQLDEIVLDYGGRTYLTKDSILDEITFKKMYSGLWEKWMEIKHKYDPENKFSSSLARRIGLCPS